MPSTRSSAATKCISEVPGLAKHTLTPPPTKVRTRLSAPFIKPSEDRVIAGSNPLAPGLPGEDARSPAAPQAGSARGRPRPDLGCGGKGGCARWAAFYDQPMSQP